MTARIHISESYVAQTSGPIYATRCALHALFELVFCRVRGLEVVVEVHPDAQLEFLAEWKFNQLPEFKERDPVYDRIADSELVYESPEVWLGDFSFSRPSRGLIGVPDQHPLILQSMLLPHLAFLWGTYRPSAKWPGDRTMRAVWALPLLWKHVCAFAEAGRSNYLNDVALLEDGMCDGETALGLTHYNYARTSTVFGHPFEGTVTHFTPQEDHLLRHWEEWWASPT